MIHWRLAGLTGLYLDIGAPNDVNHIGTKQYNSVLLWYNAKYKKLLQGILKIFAITQSFIL